MVLIIETRYCLALLSLTHGIVGSLSLIISCLKHLEVRLALGVMPGWKVSLHSGLDSGLRSGRLDLGLVRRETGTGEVEVH